MRRSGYLDTATALYELVDNAMEANARQIHVIFGFGVSTAKPKSIAVIDDGHGIDPRMLPLALSWGGTHREDSRTGFGRFGYGLPTASVSLARRVSVFSRAPGGDWFCSYIDLDKMTSADRGTATLATLRAKRLEPPEWIAKYTRRSKVGLLRGTGHGTIVLLENLDGAEWRTAIALERNLDRAFGTTYRNYLGQVAVILQGRRVEPIDPLFITSTSRYYGLDEDRALPVFDGLIAVKNGTGRRLGDLRVRAAYFPPTFARVDKTKEAVGLNANARFAVMKDSNGLIILRNGRQIDVVTVGVGTQFLNNDRYWAVEIDFSAELDELFSLTANKQRVVISDRVREALAEAGILRLIQDLRTRYRDDRIALWQTTAGGTAMPRHRTRVNGHAVIASAASSESSSSYYVDLLRFAHGRTPRRSLEALLAAISERETQADVSTRHFYAAEGPRWASMVAEKLDA